MTDVPMDLIVNGIAENIDVLPDLIERAIREGYAKRVESVVLTEKGESLLAAFPERKE